eukprot:PhF_6_TR19122/c1_g1_i1/m.28129/K10669/TRPT1, TPT1; 2'-phosphotransferase
MPPKAIPSKTMSPDLVSISKRLSYLLRHGAEKEHLSIDPSGYVPLPEILRRRDFHNVTPEIIDTIVTTNEKKRFAVEVRPDGITYIRANQGHSIEVENLELEAIKDCSRIPLAVHGTTAEAWKSISTQGLSRMTRQHIHFAQGLPGDYGVISGMRKSCEVLVYLDVAEALKDNIPLFLSTNGVVLSPGVGTTGVIPPKYFQYVTDMKGQVIPF